MPLWRRLRYGLRVLANRHAADRDLDDEARQFLEELARSFEAQGMPPDEALRAARMETGSIPGIREQVRDAGWERWVTGAMDDFRYAARRIRRSPGFTCSAILTLALGIGATSAIFAVIDRVLLKPLPYSHADRLVALTHTAPGINLKYLRMSPSLYFTYREESRVLENIALWNGNRSTVTGLGMPEEVPTLFVTTEFFDVLGVHPAIGRGFNTPDGDWNGERTAILSDAYWKQRFGAAASALGRRILVDGNAHEIVGVLPPSFEFLDEKISLVIPRPFRREELRLIQFTEDGIARLKPGVTLEQARSDLARCLLLAPRKFPLNSGFASNTFEQARISPTPRPLKDHQVGDVGETLWVLLGGVALLLLIACANVANLLLVRADARQHELAIRNALGAGWRRIARDIVTESLILGILAGAFGISICYATLRWAAHAGIGNLPRFTGISLDWRTLGFTLVISIGSAFVFGLLPVWKYAIRAADCDLGSGGGRSATHGRKQNTALRSVLVLQVALAMVLLAGSGLMLRTFQAMRSVQPGFANPAEVQIVRVSIPPARIADPEQVLRTEEAILRKFSEIPGVSGVAIATSAPMQGGNHDPVYSTDHDLGQGKIPPVRNMRSVSPGFVAVLESRLVAGRDFTWHEIYRGDSIALVSRKMARELWGRPEAALGKRIRTSQSQEWRQIVGVIEDLREDGVTQEAPAFVYWPLLERALDGSITVPRNIDFLIRSPRAGSAQFVQELQQALQTVHADLPLANVRTLGAIYDRSIARTALVSMLLSVAGGMALILGLIGTYGVVAYSVMQRRREIGIRMALGSTGRSITGMFVRQGLALAGAGAMLGMLGSVWVARLIRSLLFGVSSFDPLTYGGVLGLLLLAAALASWLPARKAAAADPIEVLRAE